MPGGPGVRIDTAAHTECIIPPYYDSMIAKVITYGRDRQEAIARMRRTLEMTVIEGIKTTIPLHLKILADPDFQAGRLSTAFMERFQAPGGGKGGRLGKPCEPSAALRRARHRRGSRHAAGRWPTSARPSSTAARN